MTSGLPRIIALDPDDYAAKYVGRTADGRQFFLTTPFDPAINGRPGNEFIALYLFDEVGKLIEAKIDELGPRRKVDYDKARRLRDQRLKELGDINFERIEVMPFVIERYGTEFGFVVRSPEEEANYWLVEVQPGNYMAFYAPWDSGEYDT